MTRPENATGAPVPDSAMSTGSEEGAPGTHLAEPPLTAQEQELLGRLREHDPPVVEPVEGLPAVPVAADDDTVLPAGPGSSGGGDSLTPQFSAPE